MPAILLTAWPLIKRFGPWVLGILLIAGSYWYAHHAGTESQKAKDDAQIAALNQTIADVRTATAKAQADDAAHAKAVETAQNTITETSNATLEKQLAAARADAAAYAQRLRQQSQAGSGGSGNPAVPEPADATRAADGSGETAELDANACAEAVTKAQGWQDWWKDVEAVPR